MFVQEFNEQFYTRFHKDQKRQKFFRLSQFGKTITEYESKLRELVDFVPELANFEEYLCLKFEEGLSLEIREKMSVFSSQNYKKVVQLVLRAEKLTEEKNLEVVFRKEKGSDLPLGNHQRRAEVQTLQKIPLVQGLILLVHHSSLDRHNHQSWEHHLKALLLEGKQC